jgi:hypothetical protein
VERRLNDRAIEAPAMFARMKRFPRRVRFR